MGDSPKNLPNPSPDWTDQLIAPQNSIDYYESVISFFAGDRKGRRAVLAEVQSFYR